MLVEADLIIRQDTAVNWTANNPILKNGQEGFETDTLKSKVGRGVEWNNTDYRFSGGDSEGPIKSYATGSANILITADGVVVIFDNGYSRVAGIQIMIGSRIRTGDSVNLSEGVGGIYNGFEIDLPGADELGITRVDFVAQ